MLHASRQSLRQLEFPCIIKCDSGFKSFRLNIPMAGAKVYFEATIIAAVGLYQIGFATSSWSPAVSVRGKGVGDDDKSIGVDVSRQCIWFAGKSSAPLMPKWSGGTVVGVGIDMSQEIATAEFFFDGSLVVAPELPSLASLGREFVAAISILGRDNQAVGLNFGERPLAYQPAGYTTVYDYCRRSFHRLIQVWDFETSTWRLLRPEDQYTMQNWDDWPGAVIVEGNTLLVRHILSSQPDIAEELVQMKDGAGRPLIGIASPSCRRVMDSFLHFMGRYEFISKIPEHKSSTCILFIAKDLGTGDLVAVKLMNSAEGFRQELDSRAKKHLDSAYVIDVVRSFNGDKDQEFRDEVQRKGFGDYNYCIVMPAAQRNLHQIMSQENVAARDWIAIRRMVDDILQCLAHLHSCRMIHGDLKPLNIMRNSKGKMILIDLDASREFGACEIAGRKFSSAFCPPEAVAVDAETGDLLLKFSSFQSRAAAAADASVLDDVLLSQSSFDLWALGATVYQMCAAEPLFLSSYGDMLDSAGLELLHEWDDELKAVKLEKITDPKARNFVSRLLCKEPQQRMSIAAALAHPFVTGTAPVRMVGDAPIYDVFISYRVASDAEYAQRLHSMLTTEGLHVFWDRLCLPDGKDWEEGFCDGLVQSKVFVCLISKDAVGHSTSPRQCFSRLTPTSVCDNVLLEHQLALELRTMGLIEFIYPVFIGEKQSDGSHTPFDWGCYGTLPDIVVSSVLEKLTGHLSRQALGVPLEPGRTVKQVVTAINANQGIKIEGDWAAAFEAAECKIVGLCKSSAASSPRASLVARLEANNQQLRARSKRAEAEKQLLQTEKDRAEAEKQQLQAEKDRAEADLVAMRKQMEAEIAYLRARLGVAEEKGED